MKDEAGGREENAVSVVLSPQASVSVSQVSMNYKAFNAGTRKNTAQKAGILRKIPRILSQHIFLGKAESFLKSCVSACHLVERIQKAKIINFISDINCSVQCVAFGWWLQYINVR